MGKFSLPSILVVVILAIAIKIAIYYVQEPEPLVCETMKKFLLASKKTSEWQLEKDPSTVGEFPKIPFDMIEECGWRSFKEMPFPYTFQFLDSTSEQLKEDYLLKTFMEKNKTVQYREVPDNAFATIFDITTLSRNSVKEGSFSEAWECISQSKCIMYFDNSWARADYETVLSKEVVDVITTGVNFGSMFLSNYAERLRTATAHAAPIKSLATQMTKTKTWDFINPKVAKEYSAVYEKSGVTLLGMMSQNQTKVLEKIPHYQVTTHPGEGLYFPEFWIHIVTSDGGMNLMTNWRQDPTYVDLFMNSPHKLGVTFGLMFKMAILTNIKPFFPNGFKKGHETLQKKLLLTEDYLLRLYEHNKLNVN